MTNKKEEKSILYYLSDKKYHIHRHVLVQLFALVYAFDTFCAVPGVFKFSIAQFCVFLAFYVIINLTIYPNVYIFVPRYLQKGKIVKYILSGFAIIIVSLFILAVMVFIFEKPNTGIFEKTDMRNIILIMITLGFPAILTLGLQVGGVAAFVFFRKWLEDNQRAEQLKAATLSTELVFLKSQINPHFLFNMLNSANILIDEDPDMSSQILIKLDDLLRYQMNDSTRDKVYLNTDIAFLRDFLDLEKTRRDEFEYTISKVGDTNNVQVAPLLFIPFVENAIKHNHNDEGLSYVYLSFSVQNDKLEFSCVNSISHDEAEKKIGGIGLANIKRRLNLLYKDNYILEQTKTDKTYTVNLKLKL